MRFFQQFTTRSSQARSGWLSLTLDPRPMLPAIVRIFLSVGTAIVSLAILIFLVGSVLIYPPGWMTFSLFVLLIFFTLFLFGIFIPISSGYCWLLSLTAFVLTLVFFVVAPLPITTDYTLIYGGLSIYYLMWLVAKLGEMKNAV